MRQDGREARIALGLAPLVLALIPQPAARAVAPPGSSSGHSFDSVRPSDEARESANGAFVFDFRELGRRLQQRSATAGTIFPHSDAAAKKQHERQQLQRCRGRGAGQSTEQALYSSKNTAKPQKATSRMATTTIGNGKTAFTRGDELLNALGGEVAPIAASGRRLATDSSGDDAIHLDERYVFDGSHSDFAQQFYRRYLAGDTAEAITDTSDLDEVLNYVSDEFGLDFDELPPLLQRAVIWDLGYVSAADLGYVKVRTKCGLRMSELALSLEAYQSAGCDEQYCASPNGEAFHQSLYCSGFQMGNVSLCAAADGITPVHGPMWSDGGTDDTVPECEMSKHQWTDAGIDYTVMAIHLSGDPNSYGKCLLPSMTIPCVAYDADSADAEDWCSPERGEIVPQWLELEKNSSGATITTGSATSGWKKAALPVTVTSVALLLLVVGAVIVYGVRKRRKSSMTPHRQIEKSAVLGGRDSDDFSMMEDMDFSLEGPAQSFPALHGAKSVPTQGWSAWGNMGSKAVLKKQQHRFSEDRIGEDLDALLLHGGYGYGYDDPGTIAELDEHEGSAHHRHYNQNQRPSKATTAGLTSLGSGATGSPRGTLTWSFAPTDRARSSTASSDPASGIMTTSLVHFQNDPKILARRVPFVDVSLLRQLTTGAYGEVWIGRLRGRLVAVKRLVRERRRHLHELEVFAAEIHLMASFSHPNILGLLGVSWSTLESLSLIMEYMEHGDLQLVLQQRQGMDKSRTRLSEAGRSPEEPLGLYDAIDSDEFSWASHKARIARDIARGLQYLHARTPTVVHRDLKSKNVLVGEDFEAKLSDFGVSRLRHGDETMTSGVGTAFWTAPEVLAGAKYSEKADVYSLGVVLVELDTHELPFFDARTEDGEAMQPLHLLSLVVSGQLQPSLTRECPPDVRALSLACMDARPEQRPTAGQVVDELSRLLSSEEDEVVNWTRAVGGIV